MAELARNDHLKPHQRDLSQTKKMPTQWAGIS